MNSHIHNLVLAGNLVEIQALVKDDSSIVNALNDFDEMPLILSLKHKKKEITNYLLQFPMDFHKQSYSYGTPLVAAVYFNNEEVVKKLIEKEKEANGSFQPQKHPGLLLTAIRNDNKSIVKLLLDEGVDINDSGEAYYEEPPYGFSDNYVDPTPFDIYGPPVFELPIIVAIQDGKVSALSILLSYKPDMNKKGTLDYSTTELIATNTLRKEVQDVLNPKKKPSMTFFAPSTNVGRPDDDIAKVEYYIKEFRENKGEEALTSMQSIQHNLLKDLPLARQEILEKMFSVLVEAIHELKENKSFKESVGSPPRSS